MFRDPNPNVRRKKQTKGNDKNKANGFRFHAIGERGSVRSSNHGRERSLHGYRGKSLQDKVWSNIETSLNGVPDDVITGRGP